MPRIIEIRRFSSTQRGGHFSLQRDYEPPVRFMIDRLFPQGNPTPEEVASAAAGQLLKEGFVPYGPTWDIRYSYVTPEKRIMHGLSAFQQATLIGFSEEESRLIHAKIFGGEA